MSVQDRLGAPNMNKDLDAALVHDFPKLYRQRGLSMRETCMCWGFSVGDGWEPLIRRLSEKLEPLGVEASQVKEKYGGLRFYLSGGSAEAEAFIDVAEAEADVTCERCGQPGTT